jgi:hypothetical protein
VLAALAAPTIERLLNDGVNVFVDAIFEIEEYQRLEKCCRNSKLVFLAIEASFEIRSSRLRLRTERPLTPKELKERDDTEISKLGTASAIANADHKIVNEQSMQIFQNALERFWTTITVSSVNQKDDRHQV